MTTNGAALCDGRIIIGMDSTGRPSIALRDADGVVGFHVSLGDVADIEARLTPGGPLVDIGALLRAVIAERERRDA